MKSALEMIAGFFMFPFYVAEQISKAWKEDDFITAIYGVLFFALIGVVFYV